LILEIKKLYPTGYIDRDTFQNGPFSYFIMYITPTVIFKHKLLGKVCMNYVIRHGNGFW